MNLKEIHNESSLYVALRAYLHPTRQEMLKLIEKEGAITVTEIWQKLDCEQSLTSGFLAILRRANLVVTTRKSKNIYYSVNEESLRLLKVLSEHWDANNMVKPKQTRYVNDVDKILDGKRELFKSQLVRTV